MAPLTADGRIKVHPGYILVDIYCSHLFITPKNTHVLESREIIDTFLALLEYKHAITYNYYAFTIIFEKYHFLMYVYFWPG